MKIPIPSHAGMCQANSALGMANRLKNQRFGVKVTGVFTGCRQDGHVDSLHVQHVFIYPFKKDEQSFITLTAHYLLITGQLSAFAQNIEISKTWQFSATGPSNRWRFYPSSLS